MDWIPLGQEEYNSICQKVNYLEIKNRPGRLYQEVSKLPCTLESKVKFILQHWGWDGLPRDEGKLVISQINNFRLTFTSEVKEFIHQIYGLSLTMKKTRSLGTVEDIYETLIVNKFDRNDMLLALGGGVTGDITGFAAATYLRGIDFVQVPTTLLSQVDSSIGGKTGVDFKAYKNMVGAFYMPKLVYMNLSTLNSLPEREYLEGMGEIIKHGLIRDKEYFYWLKENKDKIISRDYETVKKMIFVSCNIKRVVVENDPKEKGERAVLNFGHTIGHAVEKAKNFSLLHGECVAIGMAAATYISLKKGNIAEEEYNEINNVISDFKLPVYTTGILASDVVKATKNDKKMDSGVIKFITLEKNGHAIIDRTISEELLLEATETVIRG